MAKVRPEDEMDKVSFKSGSLHYNETAVDAEDDTGAAPEEEEISPEADWIRKNINQRECCRFVPKDDQDTVCCCKYPKSKHPEEVKKNSSGQFHTWSDKDCTRAPKTNAFGEIEFIGYGDIGRKYVRVDKNTKVNPILLELLLNVWGLKKPNLLISVTGGAKNFHMKQKLTEEFRRGLMKVARSTGAWIITGGTNAGVMKHVGEAVRDYGLTKTSTTPVIAIGIGTWGCIQNREDLINENGTGCYPARYRIEENKRAETCLEPNHTHFILVDDGTQHNFGVEIPLRNKIEEEVSKEKLNTGDNAVSIPKVLLVLQGGPNTLETVRGAVSTKTPIVIIEGTGKAADILAYAYQNSEVEEVQSTDNEGNPCKITQVIIPAEVEAEIDRMVLLEYGEKNRTSNVEKVKQCVQNRDLITVFKLSTTIGLTKDIDVAILLALLKANKNEVMNQLKLALAWNRIDIAKSEIFKDTVTWLPGSLDDIMLSAIKLDRVTFVELLLDNGVSVKEFLTVRMLLLLYNSDQRFINLKKRLKVKRSYECGEHVGLQEVGQFLQDLLGDFFSPFYLRERYDLDVKSILSGNVVKKDVTNALNSLASVAGPLASNEDESDENYEMEFMKTKHKLHGNSEDLENPYYHLFVWSVLMNRQDLAKLFWKEGKEPIAAALVAAGLLWSMAKRTDDYELSKKLQQNGDDFCQLAVDVLNECYEVDEQRAQDLLVRHLEYWGGTTCVIIAVETDNKLFISQTACQTLLTSIWMGKISEENSLKRILLCAALPPLVLFWLHFKEKLTENTQKKPNQTFEKKKTLTRQATMKNSSVPKDEEKKEKEGKLTLGQKIYCFYTAPIIIFVYNVVSYLCFLGLFSYMLLVELNHSLTVINIILIIWVISIFVEEIRQVVTSASKTWKNKVYSYITSYWNIVDVVTIIFFFVGMTLKFFPSSHTLEASRVILGVNLITFFVRILHIFSVHKELGPKLVMIGRMFRDLMYFVIILMVSVVSYAIASYSILYPNSKMSGDLVLNVMRQAYWNLYGELFLDDLESKEPHCSFDPLLYENGTLPRCPSVVGSYAVPFLLGAYVLFSNILLFNLLIAMFSYTFQKVQDESDTHWHYLRYYLIHEYYYRPPLPPLLVLICHIYVFFRWTFSKCCSCARRSEYDDFRKKIPRERELIQWENVIADAYLYQKESASNNSLESRVDALHSKVEALLSKVEDIQDDQQNASNAGASNSAALSQPPSLQQSITAKLPPVVERKLVLIEERINITSDALAWIIEALQVNDMATKTPPPALPNLRKIKEKEESEKQQMEKKKAEDLSRVLEQIDKKSAVHVKSRQSPYIGSNVSRFTLTDDQVKWSVKVPDYNPPAYEAPEVKQSQYWADKINLLQLPTEKRAMTYPFNRIDEEEKINRKSYEGDYAIVEGLPLNPRGRTGLIGRGLLGRWGPNHAGDPIITKWKRAQNGEVLKRNGKPVFEVILIQRLDNNEWSLPGGIVEPGQEVHECLKAEFVEEALGSSLEDEHYLENLRFIMQQIFNNGSMIYKGYTDDPRNTDNAWLETYVFHYHEKDEQILGKFKLKAGKTVQAASWQEASSSKDLHGDHKRYLKMVAERLGAAY